MALVYSFVADSVGLASVNLMQLAPKAAVLCEITRNDGHSRSFKDTNLDANILLQSIQ